MNTANASDNRPKNTHAASNQPVAKQPLKSSNVAKKSTIGVELVDAHLRKLGMVPFVSPQIWSNIEFKMDGENSVTQSNDLQPNNANSALIPPFDSIYIDPHHQQLFIVDIRVKAARRLYPDTGINYSALERFQHFLKRHRIKTFLFFIDEDRGEIYANWLGELMTKRIVFIDDRQIEYPKVEEKQIGKYLEKIVYFPIAAMSHIAMLNPDQVRQLKALTRRNPMYASGQASVNVNLINEGT